MADIVAPPLAPCGGVRASAATMARAADFLAAGSMGVLSASMLANSLRELDRFLSVLIDTIAIDRLPPPFDRVAFASRRNTPNKLRRLRAAMGLGSPDEARLREIGRARERLFHAARVARSSPILPGERLLQADLRAICALYGRIGAELVAASERLAPVH